MSRSGLTTKSIEKNYYIIIFIFSGKLSLFLGPLRVFYFKDNIFTFYLCIIYMYNKYKYNNIYITQNWFFQRFPPCKCQICAAAMTASVCQCLRWKRAVGNIPDSSCETHGRQRMDRRESLSPSPVSSSLSRKWGQMEGHMRDTCNFRLFSFMLLER